MSQNTCCPSVFKHEEDCSKILIARIPSELDVAVVVMALERNTKRLISKAGRIHVELHETGKRVEIYAAKQSSIDIAETELRKIFGNVDFYGFDSSGALPQSQSVADQGSRAFFCASPFIQDDDDYDLPLATSFGPAKLSNYPKKIIQSIIDSICGKALSLSTSASSRYFPEILPLADMLPESSKKAIEFGHFNAFHFNPNDQKNRRRFETELDLPANWDPVRLLRFLLSKQLSEKMDVIETTSIRITLSIEDQLFTLKMGRLADNLLECVSVEKERRILQEFRMVQPDKQLDYSFVCYDVTDVVPSNDQTSKILQKFVKTTKYRNPNFTVASEFEKQLISIVEVRSLVVEVAPSYFLALDINAPLVGGAGGRNGPHMKVYMILRDPLDYPSSFIFADEICTIWRKNL